MQAAGGRIGLVGEFAAGVQGCEDDLKRRLVRELRMRIYRNAPAIVGDGQAVADTQMHFDPAGMAGNSFIH